MTLSSLPDLSAERSPQLLSLAVHEFRTPASIIGGYLRMLQRETDLSLSQRQRKMIDEAEKSCARLVALIGELSDIGKLDAGLIAMARERIDVFALVAEVAKHVHEAEERDVHLVVRGESSGAPVSGDSARLRSAFDAVFRAILREKSGPCTVVAERRRDVMHGQSYALLTVAEDGSSGRQALEASHAPFDDKRGGLGLALPLARRVIEVHGGVIWSPIADEVEARGAATIALPITEQP